MTTGERRRSAMVVLGSAVVAVFAAAVPPTGGYSYGRGDRSVYDVSTVFLLSLLLVGGVSLLFSDRAARRVGAILSIAAGTRRCPCR